MPSCAASSVHSSGAVVRPFVSLSLLHPLASPVPITGLLRLGSSAPRDYRPCSAPASAVLSMEETAMTTFRDLGVSEEVIAP